MRSPLPLLGLLAGLLSAGLTASAASLPDPGEQQGEAVVAVAAQFIGVVELTGNNDGVVVEAILHVCGMPVGSRWCGAFTYVAYAIAGVDLPGAARTYAWSPTWHPKQRRVGDTRRGSNVAGAGRGSPRPGDVFGVYSSKAQRIVHVGIVAEARGDVLVTIEGNANGGLSADGDGVYKLRRKRATVTVSRWT